MMMLGWGDGGCGLMIEAETVMLLLLLLLLWAVVLWRCCALPWWRGVLVTSLTAATVQRGGAL